MKVQEDFIEDIYLGMQLIVMLILLNYGFPLFGKSSDGGMQLLSILYVIFIAYRFYSVFGPKDSQLLYRWLPKGLTKKIHHLDWDKDLVSGLIEGGFLMGYVLLNLNSDWVLSNVIFAFVLLQTIRFPRRGKYMFLFIGASLELYMYFKSPMMPSDMTEFIFDTAFIGFITFSLSIVFKEIFSLQAQNEVAVSQLKESNDKLGLMASTDYLTGLHNYKSFYQTVNDFSCIYGKGESAFSMAILDIDDFKMVNDTYGHPVGDEILAGVAKLINENIRSTDFAARYGGEEFAILFPDITLEQAEKLCERLRKSIEDRVFTVDGHAVRVTISIGVSRLEGLSEDVVSRFIKRVDTLLYDAKSSGKNKVVSQVFYIEEESKVNQ